MKIAKIKDMNYNVANRGRVIIPQIRMPEKFAQIEKEAGKVIARELENLGDVAKMRELLNRNIYNGRSHYVHGINEAMSKEFAEKVYSRV